MRLCSYVVVYDGGFAPNPFGGYCTLAACTPNHQGLRLEEGDWLVGNTAVASEGRLVYAMRVSEVLDFGDYFRDKRFDMKKARSDNWQTQCGDNIYFRDAADELRQAMAFFHTNKEAIEKDTRYPRVFISDHFFYFGENAPAIPSRYAELVRERQGCRCSYSPDIARGFVDWLERTYSPGVHGLPRDRKEESNGDQGSCSPNPTPAPDC
jgi:hypothetical protein